MGNNPAYNKAVVLDLPIIACNVPAMLFTEHTWSQIWSWKHTAPTAQGVISSGDLWAFSLRLFVLVRMPLAPCLCSFISNTSYSSLILNDEVWFGPLVLVQILFKHSIAQVPFLKILSVKEGRKTELGSNLQS